MQKLAKKGIKEFQEKILSWYEKNKRDLPWRKIPFDKQLHQRDPYKILVSEIMAQQTQLSRVIPKYLAWLERFPTVESLAEAPPREVLLCWSGLGYNSRALNLQRTATILNEVRITKYGERQAIQSFWPRTYEELIKLPGIGKYTANALLCFAFNQQVAVVDTNVRKVIQTQFSHPERSEGSRDSSAMPQNDKVMFSENEIEEVANLLLPRGKAYEWNQALMDYSAAMLKDKKIPVPKQSPFKTSNRYYRGHTMKLLVQRQAIAFSELGKYFAVHNPIEQNRLKQILHQMEKDGLVKIEGNKVVIP